MHQAPLKLMCVLAHPDDESLATGGILARYAAEGAHTSLLMATRGERGWFGNPAEYPGPQALGRIREAELRAACQLLGLSELAFLGYRDGELGQADLGEALCRVVSQIRRVQPDVLVTFDPNGMYGHPDHIAVSQLATTAVVAAADPSYTCPAPYPPHRVAKLYYRAYLRAEQELYEAAFGPLVMPVDEVERRFTVWPEWAVTTRIDVADHREQVWRAVGCHRTQLPYYRGLMARPDGYRSPLWDAQTFYRAMSLVNGGSVVEGDLFAGLRHQPESEQAHSAVRRPLAA